MNWISFLDLIREIFYTREPNLTRIQKKGLLSVKIAQVFALRIDFLDEARCLKLSRLFNHVENIPAENVRGLIHRYVGEEWLTRFKTFEFDSFASASIGQVHRATLPDGRIVAVKIIKNRFKQPFIRDVEAVTSFFNLILKIYPKLARVADPIGILTSIRAATLDELDLRNEIRHRNLLHDIKERSKSRFDLSRLQFISLHESLSSENILVSDFIEGRTFDHHLTEGTLPYDQLLELFHLHGFYLFGVGTFHGDIHPGNLILKGDDIYLVDCGVIGTVNDRMRKGLFAFMEALSWFDFPACARALHAMSDVSLSEQRYQGFESQFLQLYRDFPEKTVSEVSLTTKMMETIKLGVNAGMAFEQGIFPIIKSLMYLDGMVLRCNPRAVLMKDMRRFIDEFKGVL